jgi:ribosome assembly protein RRB1
VNHGSTEGYALEWSQVQMGHLLSGDTKGRIFLSRKTASGFVTDSDAFVGHDSSVEDLQFSPNQSNVFASASADKTIKIWDSRTKPKPQLSVVAHSDDVNVISWNRYVYFYIKSFCGILMKVLLLSVHESNNKSKLHVS